MKLFYKRPLSLILCIMLIGLFIFADTGLLTKIIASIIALALFGVSFIPKIKKHIPGFLTRVCLIVFVLTMLFAMLFFDCLYSPLAFYGEDIEATAYVTDVENYDNATVFELRTSCINGNDGANYKFEVTIYENWANNVKVGSEIVFTAKMRKFTANDKFRAYYMSNGIFATLDEFKPVSYTDEPVPGAPIDYFDGIRDNITHYAIDLCGENSGALLSALIIGERSYLSGKIELDFSRVGITHILALSGMHLVLLTAMLEKILLLFRIKKLQRNIVKIVLVILYMALTGFPSSVLRAGIMVIIALLLYMLHNNADSITSLFVSVSAIVIFNPYSIFDLSLILSFLATIGVIIGIEIYSELKAKKKSKLAPIISSIVTSLFSVATTLFLVTVRFGGLSIISPISTLLFSFIIEIFMYLGILALIIGSFIPIGVVLNVFGEGIICCVSLLSSIDFVYTPTNNIFIQIFVVIFSLAFALFAILHIKNKKRYLIILGSALGFILIFSTAYSQINLLFDDIIYYCENDDEHLIIKGSGECSVIDFTDYTGADYASLVEKLGENNISDIEQYILPVYSSLTYSGIDMLLSKIKTDIVYLPTPVNEDERELYGDLLNICQRYGVNLKNYDPVKKIACGAVSVFEIERTEYGTSTPTFTFTYLYKDKFYTHFSNGAITDRNYDTADELIANSDKCIFGSRGKKYEIKYELIRKYPSLEEICISSDDIVISRSVEAFYGDKIIYYPKKISLIR